MRYISIKNHFPKLYKYIPGWIKGTYYGITAGSGVGKTKLAKKLFVDVFIQQCIDQNIPFKIIYFALEESKDKFFATMLLTKLYQIHGIKLSYYEYKGFYGKLDDDTLTKIKDIEDNYMKVYYDNILVFDYISNPTGMYKTIKNIMNTYGTRTDGIVEEDEFGNKYSSFEYKYHDNRTHIAIIVDHISLISPEKSEHGKVLTTHEAISKWSEYVVRYICKKYQCIVCNIHQQEMAGDNIDNMKANNLEPSLTKLADNKIIGRDYHVLFGLFDPKRYRLATHNGVDILKLTHDYRGLSIIKHRDGEDNIKVPMYFDGKINEFKEL